MRRCKDSSGAIVVIVCLWAVCWLGAGCADGQTRRAGVRDAKMTFYHDSRDEKRLPAEPPVVIRDGGKLAQGTAAAGAPAYSRPYANAARNSRVSLNLPSHELGIRWGADWLPQFPPEFVFTSDDRVVVTGGDAWRILSESGAKIADGRRAPGDLVLDGGPGFFYFADTDGGVSAHRLSNGARAFYLSAWFGSEYRRDFIERLGRRMVILSIQRELSPHSDHKPNLSVVEVQEIGDPLVFTETQRLKSAKLKDYLFRDTVNMHAAMHGETLALVTENSIYLATPDLALRREFTGEFVPRAVSMDEQSRVYVLVESGDSTALWVINDRGERVVKTTLPTGFEARQPPVVGYDHTVYAISEHRMVAIAPDGKMLWDHALKESIAGAVAGLDGLMVTAGREIVAYDRSGTARVVFRAAEDRLTTPVAPIRGGLVVGGERRVYCLSDALH